MPPEEVAAHLAHRERCRKFAADHPDKVKEYEARRARVLSHYGKAFYAMHVRRTRAAIKSGVACRWNPDKRQRKGGVPVVAYKILISAKARARRDGLPFNLSIDDIVIPDTCPVLGIPIRVAEGRMSAGSPTLDRVIPRYGYVRSNVRLISWRANALKNNASLLELKKLVNYMEDHKPNFPLTIRRVVLLSNNVQTVKNRLTLDFKDHPELKAALGGLVPHDSFCLKFEMMVIQNDENGIVGDIEEIEYETPDAGGDEEKSGEVEPTSEEPVMVVIAARKTKDAKKKSDYSADDSADEPSAED